MYANEHLEGELMEGGGISEARAKLFSTPVHSIESRPRWTWNERKGLIALREGRAWW